jgi:putative acetyltransferase
MSDNFVSIHEESARDVEAVRALLKLSFRQDAEAELVDRLRASDSFNPRLSLVADIASEVVGHVLFTPVTIESEDAEVAVLSLAPLAVRPDHQREGIGQLLSLRGFDIARSLGYRIIAVVGHPSYYPRLGFVPALPLGIHDSSAHRAEASMVMSLVEGALNGIRGQIMYPPSFAGMA